MMPAYVRRLFGIRNLPLLLALPLLAAAALNLPVAQKRAVHTLQVTFDITQSMNVEDVDHEGGVISRLGLARAAARSLLLSLPCGSRLGWSVFTGHRVTLLVTPLEVCLHHDGLLSSLDNIDGRMRWVEASNIGKGLFQSLRTAQQAGDGIDIIFISDGHEAPPLTRLSGMPATTGMDARGLVAGVGGDKPVAIPKFDTEGRLLGYWGENEVAQREDLPTGQSHEQLSRLYEDHLIRLALQARLSYVRLDSAQALADAVDKSGLAKSESVVADLHWVPALLALLALCVRFAPLPRSGDRREGIRGYGL